MTAQSVINKKYNLIYFLHWWNISRYKQTTKVKQLYRCAKKLYTARKWKKTTLWGRKKQAPNYDNCAKY